MKKRLLAILMALTMVLTYMPAMAFAEEADAGAPADAPVAAEIDESEFELVAEEPKNYAGEDYYRVYIGGLAYELNTSNEADQAGLWGWGDETLSGTVNIPAQVTLSNGKTYYVNTVACELPPNVTAASVPASVQQIFDGTLGYKYVPTGQYDAYGDEIYNQVKLPVFTIFGTTGTEAQRYANANGILFRDLAAEEAARQGTPDPKIPKVTAKKAKPAKTSFTIKWKKLSKKQLKKSKATHYEVWTCKNKAFGPNDTDVKIFSKKYSALKLKGATRKTVYYYKIRAIRYVGATKMVGKWSAVKKVKTK